MAKNNDDLFEEELTAAFLGDDDFGTAPTEQASPEQASQEDTWEDEGSNLPGQLALDVYETRERLVVKCRVAGVNKQDLDVSISDNTLTIRGTLSAGIEDEVENYFVQECYWGEFARSIALPVPVKEDEIDAVLNDGLLTIGFTKLKQDTVKRIQIN